LEALVYNLSPSLGVATWRRIHTIAV
jgi:hypothetical protein